MTSLLRTTALAAVLAAAPLAASAEEAKVQDRVETGAPTQMQSSETAPAADANVDMTAVATAAGDIDLMADFERLRMLDDIGEVRVVRLPPGEAPEDTGSEEQASTEAASTEELSEQAEERVDQAFEASGQPEAGATFEPAGEPGDTAGLQMRTEPAPGPEASGAAAGQAGPADELSSTFIEDTVEQMPEISRALEESGAEASDIVGLDIGEEGDVTIYVR
jgi:hypothetical protein